MRVNHLFKVLAVLSPIVIASTFSLNSIANESLSAQKAKLDLQFEKSKQLNEDIAKMRKEESKRRDQEYQNEIESQKTELREEAKKELSSLGDIDSTLVISIPKPDLAQLTFDQGIQRAPAIDDEASKNILEVSNEVVEAQNLVIELADQTPDLSAEEIANAIVDKQEVAADTQEVVADTKEVVADTQEVAADTQEVIAKAEKEKPSIVEVLSQEEVEKQLVEEKMASIEIESVHPRNISGDQVENDKKDESQIKVEVKDSLDKAVATNNNVQSDTEMSIASKEEILDSILNQENAVVELEEKVAVEEVENKSQLEKDLEVAKKELEEAKIALKEKEAKIEEQEIAYTEMNQAYCEQKSQLGDLQERIESIEELKSATVVNPMQSQMETLMQLMAMNMMGQQGPSFNYQPSLGSDSMLGLILANQRQIYGVKQASVLDLLGTNGLNYNVYNVGGNMVGGNYENAFTPNLSTTQNLTKQNANMGPLANLNDFLTSGFNFEQSGIANESRFAQMDQQNNGMTAAQAQLQQNIAQARNVSSNIVPEQNTQVAEARSDDDLANTVK